MKTHDWAKILEYLNENNGEVKASYEGESTEDEPINVYHNRALYQKLREEIDLNNPSDDSIEEVHKHLQNTGLVRFRTTGTHAALQLKPDGFEVAHERRMSERQTKTNSALVILTLALVLINMTSNHPDQRVQVFGVVSVGIFLVFIMWGTDILRIPGIE